MLSEQPAHGASAVCTVSPMQYLEARPEVFGSELSLQHFVKRHWRQLRQRAAIFPTGGGNTWRVQPAAFDAAVRELGRLPAARSARRK